MRLFILTIICSGLVAPDLSAESRFDFREPVRPPRATEIITHRGLRTLAPGNSIAAVRECAGDFIEWAAVDVRRTKDGQHVVIDEDALSLTGGGLDARVADLGVDEIRKLQTGSAFAPRYADVHPATLPEFLEEIGEQVNVVLRCENADAEQLVREVDTAGAHARIVVAGLDRFLQQLLLIAGNSIAIQTVWKPDQLPLSRLDARLHPDVVELTAGDVTEDRCRKLHNLGIRVHANALGETNDRIETWIQLLDAGVDAILTDHAVELRLCEIRQRIPEFPVQIACHRGANRYAPENTLPAIELAAALGADYIEIDVRTTQDGRFFLLHDRSLDRTTSGSGAIREQTAAAVAELDAGSWFGAAFTGLRVPTFDEGLDTLGPRSHAYLDAKDVTPEALVAAIRSHGLIDRHVVYQSVEYGRQLQALEPAIRLLPPLRSADDLPAVAELSPYGVDARWEILSRELIARCHAEGIQVFSDALGAHENVDDYREAIGWGIDVIQTDHPLRVLRAIELEALEKEGKNRR